MDPNANLDEQLEIAAALRSDDAGAVDADRLGELVLALDEWLRGGGFLPQRWIESLRNKSHANAIRAIHKKLDGNEWSPDVMQEIARIVRSLGFEIREVR